MMDKPPVSIHADLLDKFNKMEQAGALDDLAALRRENRELDKIINDAIILVNHSTLNELFTYLMSRILDHFIPEFLAFMIQPPRGRSMLQYCYRNLKKDDVIVPAHYYDVLKQYFTSNPAAVLFVDLETALGKDMFGEDFRCFGPELIFPMTGIGGLYGIAILSRKFIGDSYTELEKLYIDRMMRFLSVSIQNGLHHESSITDAKTGLFTHDYFVKRLEEELAHAQRHGTRSGMLILDVDHFKIFNDSYGHIAGDEALIALAGVLKATTRHEDCVARFGGEEFCLLIADCTLDRLFDVAERIRQAVMALRICYGEMELGITISLGGRMIEGSPGLSAHALLSEADKALYKAKSKGRNCTELHLPGFLGRATLFRMAKESTHTRSC